jgi:hypothetical protein
MEVDMRKAFLALAIAAASFTTLAASVEPAAAWRSYRWYRDYAPLYPRTYYGPPVVYVVPPAYAYYPRPLYRYCPPGYVVGPQGTYYPRRFRGYPRGVRYYPRGYWRGCCR